MSFASEDRERSRPVLPLAGMVDVLFLLLIFFMTASTLREQEMVLEIQPPIAQTGQASAQGTQIVVTVTEDNRVLLAGQEYGPEELRAKLRALAQDFPDELVLIRPDQASDTGVFTQVVDAAGQAGLEVSYSVVPPADEPQP